jgi:4-amino-4-deoxy-L-arabinose transferase-like glycosyltransferase
MKAMVETTLDSRQVVRAVPSKQMLVYLALFALALLPRALGLGTFLTIDEANFWLRRSEAFLVALQSGDFAATALSAHPGVTTMWLGSAGIVLRRALDEWGLLHDPSFATRLALMQLPVALAHAVSLLLGYRLLCRMVPHLALPAALLWACDPFLVGYSRLLHVDALAASLGVVSLLAALQLLQMPPDRAQMADHDPRSSRFLWQPVVYLLLSGIFGGLAVLSKTPALALLPAIGLVAAWHVWWPRGQSLIREPRSQRIGRVMLLYAGWCLVLVTTIVALWPALWVDVGAAYRALREGVEVEGGQPHMLGNFFLGREVAAPGPLFYPATLALRLTPWALLGLLVLPLVWRRLDADERRTVALLAAYALLFVVALSVFPKKFNRYALPAFPALDIVAAGGLVALARYGSQVVGCRLQIGQRATLRNRAAHKATPPTTLNWTALFGLTALLVPTIATLVAMHPYHIAYFNPLLGGTAAGARTFVVGWGEGYEQAAAWLNAQPDITGVVTVSAMTPTLQPYLRPGAQAVAPRTALPAEAGYVVVYIEQVQRGNVLPPFDQFYGQATPLHTFEVGGIPYGWIYQVPPPVAQALDVGFGDTITLRGADVGSLQPGAPLALRLFWSARGAPPADYTLFVHLIDPAGAKLAQADVPPGGERPTSAWRAGRYSTTDVSLPLPATLAPGSYQLLVGLYDPATGARLPVANAQDGAFVLQVFEVE